MLFCTTRVGIYLHKFSLGKTVTFRYMLPRKRRFQNVIESFLELSLFTIGVSEMKHKVFQHCNSTSVFLPEKRSHHSANNGLVFTVRS